MSALRCYNCGELGHKTQFCPRYGPRYPEPGKTSQDYGEETQRIANLFARDIITEHEGVDIEGTPEEEDYGDAQRAAAGHRRGRVKAAAGEQGTG